MGSIQVGDVFGVSNRRILSYHERVSVDGALQDALKTDKQIVVYGSSKQGKTSLVTTHAPYDENIVISLTPKFTAKDIYTSILRKIGAELTGEETTRTQTSESEDVEGNVDGGIPGVIQGGVKTTEGTSNESEKTSKRSSFEHNIELPADVTDLLKASGHHKKFIILENFHYLNEDVQRQLAFDLRSFHELGIRFVILGVWREKNHLTQFNGDLIDRIIEVPVEPWSEKDFREVIAKGSSAFNVGFSDVVQRAIISNAFDSIGVVQELLKKICELQHVYVRPVEMVEIDDPQIVQKAIQAKVQDYSLRHQQSLEAVAKGRRQTHQTRTGEKPLFLAYYTLRVLLEMNLDDITPGVSLKTLEAEIKKIHHRGEDIKRADMINLLDGFAALQVEKNIQPPIFDYDRASKTLRVVDSSFYFFFRNADMKDILENIPNPAL